MAEQNMELSEQSQPVSEELKARRAKVFDFLKEHGIEYTTYDHPEAPTIEIARQYWRQDGSKHCKNLFFRNHKGNRHYLVVFDSEQSMAIHDMEKMLRQGKLSFASEQRMMKYLGLKPGSVSPFGLINDEESHVHLFLDANLKDMPSLSFHPNDNTATVVISQQMFMRYLEAVGNTWEWIELY
jgi:Ala-tRNA(Pro) deacylase